MSPELAIATAIARDSLPERECTRCGEIKSPAEFQSDAHKRDGLYSQCRACCREKDARKHAKRKARNEGRDPYSDPSLKRCSDCGRDLPRREFSRNATQADGLDNMCRDCCRERDVRLRAKRKAENAAKDPYADPTPKHCPDCGRDLPRSEFSRSAARADGLYGVCRSCNRSRVAAWARQNPDKKAAKDHRRRAAKALVPHFPYDAGALISAPCYACGAPAEAVEHFYPLARWWDPRTVDGPTNVLPACTACNSSKQGHDPVDWLRSRGSLIGRVVIVHDPDEWDGDDAPDPDWAHVAAGL